jgi:serine/threonine protein phosphatase PrpC
MGTEGSGATRAGGEGFHNEDVFVVEEGLGLYVVCDGVGDTAGGRDRGACGRRGASGPSLTSISSAARLRARWSRRRCTTP